MLSLACSFAPPTHHLLKIMLSLIPLLLFPFVSAVVNGTIPSRAMAETECKTCPYNLCPNKAWDDANTELTCWTEGSLVGEDKYSASGIVNTIFWSRDSIWLKTKDNCYVTQWDMVEYSGDCICSVPYWKRGWPYSDTTDLPYCGRIREKWTDVPARTKYVAECYYNTRFDEFIVKRYKYEIDLTLTCVTRNSSGTSNPWDILGKTWGNHPSATNIGRCILNSLYVVKHTKQGRIATSMRQRFTVSEVQFFLLQ